MTVSLAAVNFRHLFYFWTVLRAGTIAKACEQLDLAPPTVSTQLRLLEEQLGETLLVKRGRGLAPTDAGSVVFRYAQEIFETGEAMIDALQQRPTGRAGRVVIGIDDVVPKEI